MPQITVERVDEKKSGASSVWSELEALSERVRQRAFDRFEKGGYREGYAMGDWLDAERDLLLYPESELLEKESEFEFRVSAPGFEAGDIKVTALPDALLVQASASTHSHDKSDGKVRFCEFGQKTLFRRFDMPEPINPDKVAASLEKGMLHIVAPKTRTEVTPRRQSVAA
jgi:HSP20 family protein